MSRRAGSQSRLGEWKSRSTQVGGASIAGCRSSRQSARNVARSISGTGRCKPRQIPVEQQLGLDQESIHVVGRDAVIDMRRDRQHVGQMLRVQRQQHVDRGLVAVLDRVAGGSPATTRSSPRSSMMQQALLEIGVHRSRAPRSRAARSPFAMRDERHDALGEMRDRAVGLAVAHRRAVGAARRVHQDHVLLAERQAARRSGSRHRPACARAARRCSRSRRRTGGPPRCGRRARANEP